MSFKKSVNDFVNFNNRQPDDEVYVKQPDGSFVKVNRNVHDSPEQVEKRSWFWTIMHFLSWAIVMMFQGIPEHKPTPQKPNMSSRNIKRR